jgi:hypothetical protein
MKKEILILLSSLIVSHELCGMKFKKHKKERHVAQKQPYTQEDKKELLLPLSTIIAGTAITSAGYALQEPIMIGFGAGLIIGGTDDVNNYYKFQRRYNQKIAQ